MRRRFDFGALGAVIIILLAVALILICVFAIINNEINRISEGTIVDKQIQTGYSDAYISNGTGSYNALPTQYLFLLEGEKNGRTVRYWTKVSAEEYSEFRVGEYYRK